MNRQQILGRRGTQVKLDGLDALTVPFAMSFGFDLKGLRESIRAVGLVNPPCIGKDTKGGVEVITGYRRLLALKELGWTEVICEDLSSSLSSPRERLLFAFHENLASRVFNSVEKAMILHHLADFVDKKVLLRDYMPLLALPSHDDTLSFYLRLAEMEHAFLEALAQGHLALKAAQILVTMDSRSREAVLRSISEIKLSFNQQMQFIDMLIDISTKERLSVAQLLDAPMFQQIMLNSRLNNPQKAKVIIDELRIRNNPRLGAAEKRFQEKVHRLSLPGGVRIDHAPFFEAPGYRLEVQFQNGEKLMEKLRQIDEHTALKEFGDPLFDDDQESLD